jgi:hypothetical protein
MADERRAADPDGGSEGLLQALRNLGADHEPDVEAITRRVHGTGNVIRPRTAPAGRRRPVAVRYGRPVLLPATAVLLVIGGIVLTTSVGGSAPDPDLASPVPIATIPVGTPSHATGTATPTTSSSRVIGPAVSATRPPTATTSTGPAADPTSAEISFVALAPRCSTGSRSAPVRISSRCGPRPAPQLR